MFGQHTLDGHMAEEDDQEMKMRDVGEEEEDDHDDTSDSEDDSDEDSSDETDEEEAAKSSLPMSIPGLEARVKDTGGRDYDAHAMLVKELRQKSAMSKLENARKAFSKAFPLPEGTGISFPCFATFITTKFNHHFKQTCSCNAGFSISFHTTEGVASQRRMQCSRLNTRAPAFEDIPNCAR